MADEPKEVDQHKAAEEHPRPSPIMDGERPLISDLIPNPSILLILYLCILNLSQRPIHPLVHHFERLDPIQQLPESSMHLMVDQQLLRPRLLPPPCCRHLVLSPQWVPQLPRLPVQCPPMQFNRRSWEDQHSICPFLRILPLQYTVHNRSRMSAN